MALSQSNSSMEPRSWSVGPVKQQIINISVENGDTSAAIVADNLSSIEQIIVGGSLVQTAAPSYSGNTATITFADPLATVHSQVICMGR